MSEVNLTPTSYIVLGLLETTGGGTPYDLKRMVAVSVGNFWSVQHSQLYSEAKRLAEGGHLSARRERGGRRRVAYALTDRGRDALSRWRSEPTAELSQVREPGLLKLFFGADPGPLAEAQLEGHRARLAEYEALRAADSGAGPRGPWRALDAGTDYERGVIAFWERVARDAADGE